MRTEDRALSSRVVVLDAGGVVRGDASGIEGALALARAEFLGRAVCIVGLPAGVLLAKCPRASEQACALALRRWRQRHGPSGLGP